MQGDAAGFRDVLFTHAIEGTYSVPEYGGNLGLELSRALGRRRSARRALRLRLHLYPSRCVLAWPWALLRLLTRG